MQPLTKRQRQVLDFIRERVALDGYCPSISEIGAQFGVTSISTIHRHLVVLGEKGYIKRRRHAKRFIELLESPKSTEQLALVSLRNDRDALLAEIERMRKEGVA